MDEAISWHLKHFYNIYIDDSKPFAVVPVETFPAPRMVRGDKWKRLNDPDPKKRQRECVTRYFNFRHTIQVLTLQQHYKVPANGVLNAVFIMEMPKGWSMKKKDQMNLTPHTNRPDRDNLIKSIQDALCPEDGFIWDGRITKLWGYKPLTILY